MAQSDKIKWRKIDKERVTRIARLFNAKITRVLKKSPELIDVLPKRLDTKEMTRRMQQGTRRDFDREMKRLERFLRKGAEMPYTTKAGVNTTVWQKKEIDNTFRSINAKRRKELAKLEPSIYKGTMHTIESNNLQQRKNTVQEIIPKFWDKFVENLYYQEMMEYRDRSEEYKTNFLHAIEVTLGKQSRLYRIIENLPSNKIYKYSNTDPLLAISFLSDPMDEDEIEELMVSRLELKEGGKIALEGSVGDEA